MAETVEKDAVILLPDPTPEEIRAFHNLASTKEMIERLRELSRKLGGKEK